MTGSEGPLHDGYDDLRRALQVDAEQAAQADARVLWSSIGRAVHRRRRRRRVAGAVVATTLSAVLGTVVLQALPGQGREPDRLAPVGRSASPAEVPSVRSTSESPGSIAPSAGTTVRPGAARTPLAERALPVTPDAARVAVRQAGYDQDDVWQLAQVWRWGDVRDVEVIAGARLLRGEVLPLRPGQPAAGADDGTVPWLPYENLLSYAGAGYDDHDAVALAQRWQAQQTLVRMLIGELVRAGELPPAAR